MSAIILGKKTQLLLGTSQGSQVNFTGVLDGTDQLTRAAAAQTRPIPGGRGVAAAQQATFITNTLRLVCDSNSVHDPVLRGKNIQRLYFTLQSEGAGSANPQVTGQCVARITLDADAQLDVYRWQVTLEVDGNVDATPQT